MKGYLTTADKSLCTGCEACVQVCPRQALRMAEDAEGFRYPVLDEARCVHCGLCSRVCPCETPPESYAEDKVAFGGCHRDVQVKGESTSGGAFSAIVDGWCDENYVIFGAAAEGLRVYHGYITDKSELRVFRKSKYSQSEVGTAYTDARRFLQEGRKVLFSGTPCQIAGLLNCLGDVPRDRLLTVEVICEGVPSPLFVRRYEEYMLKKHGAPIRTLDYRYKDMRPAKAPVSGKWDFQVMKTELHSGRTLKKDRWFNPFWSIWLSHLMSRPSCYRCPYANTRRVADISLGDLWGVHLYCPELYGRNGGASLVVCNTARGCEALELALPLLEGHELEFETALKYQSPMRKTIDGNPDRDLFMRDLTVLDYISLCRKWAKRPTLKLLYSKYVWGNRQKVFMWNLRHRSKR